MGVNLFDNEDRFVRVRFAEGLGEFCGQDVLAEDRSALLVEALLCIEQAEAEVVKDIPRGWVARCFLETITLCLNIWVFDPKEAPARISASELSYFAVVKYVQSWREDSREE